ncbi:NAD(P)H-binding protein [Aquiflexum sp. LQ15W]|uniref:NAD(P)-dependent oxidoreductase n=1 Tax=Cognataquiflexum nitidum TaxID=2922272 RepID=UPI001F12EB51|nr:NAD(P)H-binding protein [Cognataquiflexum nitidum]MCH6200098.1 NAD(P)H-binding protein [Cognataquiflexum nitidum]
MEPIKRILLLGATGRTGNEVLQRALEKGYHVNALVRVGKKIQLEDPRLQVFEGDTRIPRDLNLAMENCQAVISCLNISRKSDFPWSPLRTPEDFLSMTMKTLIKVCYEQDIKRLIFTSAWGVGDSRPYIPGWFAWLIDNSNLSVAYLEHERQEALVRNSGLDWTIVRPVGLTNGQKPKEAKVILDHGRRPSLTISRKATASFLVDILEHTDYVHKVPVVYS